MSRFRGCCIPLYTPTSHDDVTRENVGLEWIFVMLSWLNKKHSHCVAMILIMITTLDAFFSYFCDCFASWFYSCRNLVHGHTPTTLFLIPPIHMFPLGKTQSKTNKQRKAIFFTITLHLSWLYESVSGWILKSHLFQDVSFHSRVIEIHRGVLSLYP